MQREQRRHVEGVLTQGVFGVWVCTVLGEELYCVTPIGQRGDV